MPRRVKISDATMAAIQAAAPNVSPDTAMDILEAAMGATVVVTLSSGEVGRLGTQVQLRISSPEAAVELGAKTLNRARRLIRDSETNVVTLNLQGVVNFE